MRNGGSFGTTCHGTYNVVRNYDSVAGSVIMNLAASDYVQVFAGFGGSPASLYGGGYNVFSGHLIA